MMNPKNSKEISFEVDCHLVYGHPYLSPYLLRDLSEMTVRIIGEILIMEDRDCMVNNVAKKFGENVKVIQEECNKLEKIGILREDILTDGSRIFSVTFSLGNLFLDFLASDKEICEWMLSNKHLLTGLWLHIYPYLVFKVKGDSTIGNLGSIFEELKKMLMDLQRNKRVLHADVIELDNNKLHRYFYYFDKVNREQNYK